MGGCQGKEVAACSPQEMANGRVSSSRALDGQRAYRTEGNQAFYNRSA